MTSIATASPPLEMWGGIECTVNRVGDRYGDQLDRSGHVHRAADLELIAALGVRALRYPVLWERHERRRGEPIDWRWASARLERLRLLGVRPIVGLVHHGSGPAFTSLIDPSFATGLARYARAVAERFPWVEDWTPVNEPLTTARFSGLYGLWHPHGRDDATFVRTLLVQCRAIVLAMRAIRQVNPRARLVQTDDLGHTFAAPALRQQAEFDNTRRWLGWDLVCGRVDDAHPLHAYLLGAGAAVNELEWFRTHRTPPDIIGINHYVTSERFLDDRLDRYPPHLHGGNGRQAYVDTEAVRVRRAGIAGPRRLLMAAWDRYRLPVVITEAHLGCTREEQMRWLAQAWRAAGAARRAGADVRAVTAWSLLGAYDWNTLLTHFDGHYEPGAFDVRGGTPRATALARLVAELATRGTSEEPLLRSPGWWQRPERLTVDPPPRAAPMIRKRATRPVVILGATGTLGAAFARIASVRGLPHRLLGRSALDITSPPAIERMLAEMRPWAVVNAAGYVRVDDAEREPDACRRANALGPMYLARACAHHGARFLTFSSDLVFDGQRQTPYLESDAVAPLNVYGQSKALAESLVRAAMPEALVVRTSAFFGPWDRHNFVHFALASLRRGERFEAADDAVISPTYVPDLVDATLDLLLDHERGVWHLANAGATTWAGFAREAARAAGRDPGGIAAVPSTGLGHVAVRPGYSVLASERAALLPPFEHALARYVREPALV